MSKKNRKDKQVAALRREIELLRHQVGVTPKVETPVEASISEAKIAKPGNYDEKPLIEGHYLQADLRKTGILTLVCLGIVGVLAATQPHWPQYYSTASQKLTHLLKNR